jgi:hypothetical protein
MCAVAGSIPRPPLLLRFWLLEAFFCVCGAGWYLEMEEALMQLHAPQCRRNQRGRARVNALHALEAWKRRGRMHRGKLVSYHHGPPRMNFFLKTLHDPRTNFLLGWREYILPHWHVPTYKSTYKDKYN